MSAPDPQRRRGATPLSRFVPEIAAEALRKHGFANFALLANWREIAGPALASHAVPAKLTRPVRPMDPCSDADIASGQPAGGTLLLKVDPARSLEVQYLAPQLIERINACLGYRAVSAIRLVHAPMVARDGTRPAAATVTPAKRTPMPAVSAPKGDRLSAAIARLKAGHANRSASDASKARQLRT